MLWIIDYFAFPSWLANLLVATLLIGYLVLGGLVLMRTRISPLWALLLIVPVAQILVIWMVALRKWPVDDPQ